jgi:valyl-tRNA synthetase
MGIELAKGYEPKLVEERWLEQWIREGFGHADEAAPGQPYSIVIPPPNVTGSLHMGHALNNTLQDILCRWRRMRGDTVLWVVGTDHAGIATQNVVERELAKQGTSREELGRERFIERVWEWRKEYGGRIIHQLQRLGCSCDWERERFTMDEGLSRAVREVFVRLYEEGLIYRGLYLINWCPRCRTALSDLEVEYEDVQGHLYHVRYPLTDGPGCVTVATTRPETMLGDTAVAVHPEDERYAAFGDGTTTVTLPFVDRPIPIIADAFVDRSFGTGAVKITPAHDATDNEVGRRRGLPSVKVIDEDGRMTAEAGPFAGMDRFECRREVVRRLEEMGLLERIDDHSHAVGHCYRCKNVIEPNLSRQWFVKTGPLARAAIGAVEEGRIRIIPGQWEKTYFEWMNNIRDWCISRQIWWGHRIPAWYCGSCGETIVSREDVSSCPACGGGVTQETDVLDTWFSSALWPFSTLGWPDRTPLLARFYPTTVLVTAFDILFFWVARMIMMGLKFMDEVPFRDVYIHALVRDAEGQKMSKSKGNVVDPLLIMDQYGTDAFRFALTAFAAQGRDIKLAEDRIEGYRHFCNKIWNASRFVLMNLDESRVPRPPVPGEGSAADAWILSRLAAVADEVNRALEGYRFNEAAASLYSFVWHEYCDWYLEMAKMSLYGTDTAAKERVADVLVFVLDAALRLLHPVMPFITEEIRARLPGRSGGVMSAPYPTGAELAHFRSEAAEKVMAVVMETVTGIRTIRGEMDVPPSLKVAVVLKPVDADVAGLLEAQRGIVAHLAGVGTMEIGIDRARPSGAASIHEEHLEVYVPLGGLMNLAQERERLVKNLAKLDRDLVVVEKKLSNEDFLNRAPAAVVAELRERRGEFSSRRERIVSTLGAVEEAMGS